LRYFRILSYDNLLHVIAAKTFGPLSVAAKFCRKVRNYEVL